MARGLPLGLVLEESLPSRESTAPMAQICMSSGRSPATGSSLGGAGNGSSSNRDALRTTLTGRWMTGHGQFQRGVHSAGTGSTAAGELKADSGCLACYQLERSHDAEMRL
jgi:hypothetical protein